MTATSAPALTVSTLLFGGDDPAMHVGAVLGAAGGIAALAPSTAHLPRAVHDALHDESARAARALFDVDATRLVLQGWRKHEDLRDAARHTLATSGSSETVALASHTFTQKYEPALDVYYDGQHVDTIQFTVTIDFAVATLVAVVREGRLCALRSGDCDVSATLAVQGVDALQRQSSIDLALVVPLGDGIALLSDEEAAQATLPRG